MIDKTQESLGIEPVERPRTRANPVNEPTFDVDRVRADFPILHQSVHDHPLVYLDSAASTQKPRAVIDEMARFYAEDYANVHRGVYALGERATRQYEGARETVRAYLGAAETREIVFVRGTTEAINLVAQSFGRDQVGAGDEVIVSEMEHHSNIVPWQLLCEQVGATLRVIPMDDDGVLDLDRFEELLSDRTKIVAVTHLSNALGTVNPVRKIIAMAHERGVPVLLDGAQSAPRLPVDVRELDVDFYAFSSHKVYGPSGVGVLYAKAEHLESMRPYQGGGEMIQRVTFEKTTYHDIPWRFEAGTPNIGGVIGLAAALRYIESLGREAVDAHEASLLEYAESRLDAHPSIKRIGNAPERAGLVTFEIDGVHPHDAATFLDRDGVAVRAGHHCAQPTMDHFGVSATLRASFGAYNCRGDIDALMAAIDNVKEFFG